MIPTKQVSPDVHYADAPIVHAGEDDARFLLDRVPDQEKRRMRICAHRDTEDALQEMLIAFTRGSYLRPSYHTKEESIHIVEGEGTYVFFDAQGEVTRFIPLGGYGSSGRRFYCRIPRGTYHALVVESDAMLVHEVTEGPFEREHTIFADWAPDEGDPDAAGEYLRSLEELVRMQAPEATDAR